MRYIVSLFWAFVAFALGAGVFIVQDYTLSSDVARLMLGGASLIALFLAWVALIDPDTRSIAVVRASESMPLGPCKRRTF